MKKKPEMKLVFTEELPTEPGYYWWTNFGEHTPTIVEVKEDYRDGGLWADNGEFQFKIETPDPQKNLELGDEDDEPVEGKYKYGDELWCRIPNPCLPGGKKQVEPSCY